MSSLVRRYVASRTDISEKAQQQYEWAIPDIERWLGAIRSASLDRDDVARWIDDLTAGDTLSRRSVSHLPDRAAGRAVGGGRRGPDPALPRGPGGLPRTVAKPVKGKDAVVWTVHQFDRFLVATADHRWAMTFRLGVLYRLRRSDVLALRRDGLDTEQQTLPIDESFVAIPALMTIWPDSTLNSVAAISRILGLVAAAEFQRTCCGSARGTDPRDRCHKVDAGVRIARVPDVSGPVGNGQQIRASVAMAWCDGIVGVDGRPLLLSGRARPRRSGPGVCPLPVVNTP